MRFPNRSAWTALIVVTTVFAMLVAPSGCAPASKRGASPHDPARSDIPEPVKDAPGRSTAKLDAAHDPCVERLHALAGHLLAYYALNRTVPEHIEELAKVAGPLDEPPQFACPVSGRPYLYVPAGVPRGDNKPGTLVLFDSTPAHAGMRWAVAVDRPRGPGQLVTKVVAEPESTFHPRE